MNQNDYSGISNFLQRSEKVSSSLPVPTRSLLKKKNTSGFSPPETIRPFAAPLTKSSTFFGPSSSLLRGSQLDYNRCTTRINNCSIVFQFRQDYQGLVPNSRRSKRLNGLEHSALYYIILSKLNIKDK